MAYADDLSALVVTSPKQPPPLPLPVFILLAHLALACVMAIRPPAILRTVVSLLLISANIYGAVAYTVGKAEDDYALGSTVWGPTTLSVMLFTWLIPDPLRDIRYLSDAVPLVKKPRLTRIWYAVCLHYNWRFIGTNAQVCCSDLHEIAMELTMASLIGCQCACPVHGNKSPVRRATLARDIRWPGGPRHRGDLRTLAPSSVRTGRERHAFSCRC